MCQGISLSWPAGAGSDAVGPLQMQVMLSYPPAKLRSMNWGSLIIPMLTGVATPLLVGYFSTTRRRAQLIQDLQVAKAATESTWAAAQRAQEHIEVHVSRILDVQARNNAFLALRKWWPPAFFMLSPTVAVLVFELGGGDAPTWLRTTGIVSAWTFNAALWGWMMYVVLRDRAAHKAKVETALTPLLPTQPAPVTF